MQANPLALGRTTLCGSVCLTRDNLLQSDAAGHTESAKASHEEAYLAGYEVECKLMRFFSQSLYANRTNICASLSLAKSHYSSPAINRF